MHDIEFKRLNFLRSITYDNIENHLRQFKYSRSFDIGINSYAKYTAREIRSQIENTKRSLCGKMYLRPY